MKKTLFLLMALASAAQAETYTLQLYDVMYKPDTGDSTAELTSGNRAITWNDSTDVYSSWYMEFTLPIVTASDYKASITTEPKNSGGNSSGLSVSTKSGYVTLGYGNENVYDRGTSLSFSSTDTLTFAYYNGAAYLGNKTTGKYLVSYYPDTTTSMTSGTSRAWANNSNNVGTTQIGSTRIASLQGMSSLDIATLVKTGMAQSGSVSTPNYLFAAAKTETANNKARTVSSGSTDSAWAAAFGNAVFYTNDKNVLTNNDSDTLVLTGNVSMTFNGDFAGGAPDSVSGGTTVFGIVNAGKVTGNVNLVFDAANANYGSFTNTGAASVVGAYKGTIDGTFSATINSGTFAKDIMGGIHTGDTNSIGATSLVINGGSIGGNVYGGGRTGTIKGNTAVSITSLTPFASHTASNIISAGGSGTGGTIEGDASVSFSGVSGSYAGTVSGGSNVEGTSSLSIAGSSTLSLNKVEDFDTIDIAVGSSLTITGSLSGGSGIGVTYDANSTHITNKTNGLGDGIFDLSSYITGEGSFAMDEGATYNGLIVESTDDRNLHVSNAIYYVTKANDTEYTGADANYTYVLSDEKSPEVSEVIHIGEYVGSQEISYNPIPDSVANAALAYYVEEGGTLAISGASKANGLSAGQMLVNTFGNGDIILRAQGYKNDVLHEATEIIISETTKATGNLYISPKVLNSATTSNDIQPVKVLLEDGADISSFSSVTFGCQNGDLAINGLLGSDTQGHHINNLQLFGSGYNHIYINTDENEEIVLGGTTTLRSYKYYEPESAGHMGAQLRIVPNQSSTVRIEDLSSGTMDADTARAKTSLLIQSAYDQTYSYAAEVNAVVHIDSFNFRGGVQINGSQVLTGTIDVNITLKDNQWISSDQYISPYSQFAKQKPSLTLKGTGTYILEDTKDIIINIGRLSTEVKDGDHLWQGTVQLSNVNATSDGASATGRGMDFAYYGNEQSTVDIQGFKGDVVKWSESGTVVTDQPESVEIVSALKLTNTNTMSAYEVTGGITTQNYTGAISGEGDFVVSATNGKNINLSGELKGWNGNLKATAGEQNVTLSGAATTVNAAIKAEGGSLNLTVDNSGKTTTFNKEVKVTSLTVNSGSTAMLTQESTAGTVKLTGEALELSGGISITDSTLRSGRIANGSITSTATTDTVELDGISASNLRLYGEDVTFHSNEEADVFFMAKEVGSHTEVSFSSDIFSGMTLADDGALASLSVSNTIDGAVTDLKRTNVTIFLEGFTMEKLEDHPWGDWDWKNTALSIDPSEATTFSGGVTVQELLEADYASVTYSQTASGLKIRMQNIPEPTSATLSLLALAGLAARRRRK